MMNYIATSLVSFFLIIWTPDGSSSLKEFKVGHLPMVYNQYLLLVIIVGLLTVGMYIYLKYSKQGYEISVVGESRKTACYIGISVKKVIIRTMIVSGALCGLAGFLIVGALDHSITVNSVGGRGFTAIMVSWLGKFNPYLMVLTSFLIVFLEHGAQEVSSDFPTINSAFPSIITGIILFFIIGCEFFINYKLVMRQKEGSVK
jgi:simple sugar transport system permease protein